MQSGRRHFDEIFNRKNLDACNGLMAVDFVEHGVAPFASKPPGSVNGPAATRGTAEWLLGQFPDMHMMIEAIVAEGDLVACRVVAEGTNMSALNPRVPATGRRFSARQSHWFRIEANQLVEHWATRDDLSAMLQLGVIQPRTGDEPNSPPPMPVGGRDAR